MSERTWPLEGKTALITGGAKRIGRATASALAGEGVHVVVHYGTSRDPAEELVGQLKGQGVRAWSVQADLADAQQAQTLLDQAVACAGTIDIVINNASIFPESTLRECTAEDLARNVQINATSPFLIGRALADHSRDGVIVNFLDSRMVDYDAKHAAYHVSKRMLLTLTRMMALEFAPAIRVNAVAPGLILPPVGKDASYLERFASSNPLGRVGTLAEVTEAVLFLCGSAFVTGQILFVDGGRHMKGNVYGA